MTRRTAVSVLVPLLLLVLVAACGGAPGGVGGEGSTPRSVMRPSVDLPTASTPAVKRPNILVVETDDMRSDELKVMPNVRKLIGGRGLSFENSFAPYPLCCPSRASFLTGKYAHNHKVLSVINPFAFQSFDDRTTIATVLHKAGYQTGLNGKYLNGYGKMPQYQSNKPSLHYVPPGWDQWYAGLDHSFGADSPLRGGTYSYFSMTQNQNGKVVGNQGRYSTYLLGDQTRKMVTEFGAKKKPWFIWSTPVAPHFGNPREPDDPRPVANDNGKVVPYKTPGRPAWVRDYFDDEITHAFGTPPSGPAEKDMSDKPRLMQIPEMNAREKAALTEVARQRAQSLFVVDRQLGKTLETLKKTGQYDDTVVVFTSDNGYYLGEHRKRQGKILVHEPSLRVPLLMAGPGIPHGRRYDPITTVDLAPTFAALAGVTMPDADGVSMVPVIKGGDRGWTTPVVTEGTVQDKGYFGNHTRSGFGSALDVRGIRLGRYKYTKYATGETELYDLKKDPLELHGLQTVTAYAGIRAQMDKLWRQYSDCVGSGCDTPLPARFRSTPAQEKAITVDEDRRTRAFYGDYPIRVK